MPHELFWLPERAQHAGAFATVAKMDHWLFFSAQVPRDLDTGAVPGGVWDLPKATAAGLSTGLEHRDGREGAVRAQTWLIYTNLAKMLSEFGVDLEDIVRQRIYVWHQDSVIPMEETMLSFFDGGVLPATHIVCAPPNGVGSSIHVQVEVVAFLSDSDSNEIEREQIDIAEMEFVTAPYPQAVRTGQLVFFSGIQGVSRRTGRIATRLDELEHNDRSLVAQNRYYSDTAHEPLVAQHSLIFSHLRKILEYLGGTLDDLVRQNYLTTASMATWGVVSQDLRRSMYSSQQNAPGVTTPAVARVSANPDVAVSCDAVALLRGQWVKEGHLDSDVDMGFLPMVVEAGPLVYTTGYVGMDKAVHGTIARFRELEDSGSYLGHGRIDDAERPLAQAWHTYRTIAELLNGRGSDIRNVVQQSVYIKDPKEYALLQQVARVFYGNRLPPTTIVPIADVGPYPGLRFEIDTVAAR